MLCCFVTVCFKRAFVIRKLVISVFFLERSIRFAGGISSLICLFLFSLLIAGVAPSLRWREGEELRVSAPAWRQTRQKKSPSACINRWLP